MYTQFLERVSNHLSNWVAQLSTLTDRTKKKAAYIIRIYYEQPFMGTE